MKLRYHIMAILIPTLLAGGQSAAGQSGLEAFESEFVKLIAKIRPSVVAIRSTRTPDKERDQLLPGRASRFSGVVVDDRGHIVTVSYGVAQGDRIVIVDNHGREHPARFIGSDTLTRIAVVKVEGGAPFPPVRFADSDRVQLGSLVVTVGNPFGYRGSVASGIVSGLGRTVQVGNHVLPGMIQTTAPINPGDAGGLVANSRGELLGLVCSTFGRAPSWAGVMERIRKMGIDKYWRGRMGRMIRDLLQQGMDGKKPQDFLKRMFKDMARLRRDAERAHRWGGPGATFENRFGAQLINFVLPANIVRRVVAELVARGKVERGWLGASLRVDFARELPRLTVSGVAKAGPAAVAGLAVGDLVVRYGSERLRGLQQLGFLVALTRPGTEVEVVVSRGGKEHSLKVKIGQHP